MKIPSAHVKQVYKDCQNSSRYTLIDIRSLEERQNGVVQQSITIAANELLQHAKDNFIKDHTYYIICQKGISSASAIQSLIHNEIDNAINVDKGFEHWQGCKLPVEIPVITTPDLRYSRHYQLQGFGKEAQEKLSDAHVLLIGAGGLGSSSALYLAAVGVGTLTIIDDDVVQLSNLQRQIIHTTDSIDSLKVDSAKSRMQAINPEITIEAIAKKLNPNNAEHLIVQADVIIDGTDNLKTRYLVNDLCIKHKKPLVYAAVYQFEAQISVFDMRLESSPCLRCLFPYTEGFEPANCSTEGVLGVVPGFAGILQATEAIKLITQIGQTLQSKLLISNLLDNSYRTIKYKKDKNCKLH
jgi:molybdopterin/thiamine biosynthesis adenylyltransferase/rhodanese-related sulfurtransferase